MYEPNVTIITATSNIVEKNQADDFTLLVNLLDRQSYPYVEHLVMDNASTDGTLELLKDYKNSNYIKFFSAPDNGKFDAYNKGLLSAKGKYVAFVSCDDFYHDILGIADVVETMESSDADFCYAPVYCVQPNNEVFVFNPSIFNTFQVVPCPRQALFFKRSVLDQLKGFDTTFKLLADYDLIIRLLLNRFKGVYFDGSIMTCRQGEQVAKYSIQTEAECSHIFHKNFKTMYHMSDAVLERMVQISEIPKPLLDQLAKRFPGDEAIFYERYNQMYQMRSSVRMDMRQNERNRR